jgi:NADPH:quinone reductase-like Zn-dependent oxidoreductase
MYTDRTKLTKTLIPSTPTMRAVQIDNWGDATQLRPREVTRPSPGPGQVLVRVAAASVNAVDRRVREGYLADRLPLPYTAGSDFSGIVETLGEGADLATGTPVFGGLWPMSGAYAEYIVFPAAELAVKPDSMSFEAAAALPIAGLTAQVAVAQADIRPGQRVLVQGAGGGVGHLALQMAKRLGAYVIGTASSTDLDLVRKLGADEAIDYRDPDLACSLHEIDVLIDGVSATNIARFYPSMRPGSVAISLFDPPPPAATEIRAEIVATAGLDPGSLRDRMTALAAQVVSGGLRIVVSRIYSIDEAGIAQDGRKRGKVVIVPEASLGHDLRTGQAGR